MYPSASHTDTSYKVETFSQSSDTQKTIAEKATIYILYSRAASLLSSSSPHPKNVSQITMAHRVVVGVHHQAKFAQLSPHLHKPSPTGGIKRKQSRCRAYIRRQRLSFLPPPPLLLFVNHLPRVAFDLMSASTPRRFLSHYWLFFVSSRQHQPTLTASAAAAVEDGWIDGDRIELSWRKFLRIDAVNFKGER